MADKAEAPKDEDVDDAEDGDDGEGGKKKKKPSLMKLGLFAGLPVLVLVMGGVAAFMLLGGDKGDADADAEAAAHGEAGGHGPASAAAEVVFYELPNVLVNIQSDDGRPSFIKLRLTLELDSEDAAHAIEPAMPRVMDRFNAFLRELRVEDLAGSAGSYRLRLELLRRVNIAVAPVQVRAVLIEEMLIQ